MRGLAGPDYTALKQQLNSLYGDCCEHHTITLAADDWMSEIAAQLNAVVEQIFALKGMPAGINKPLVTAYAKLFSQAVEKGYGKSFSSIDYDTPDGKMLASLQKNVWQFAAAKNYQQLKALSQALVDDTGKLRTWQQFKTAAYEINNEHVNTWLKTEYDTAVGSAQMAGKWVDIQANKATLPLLEFDAILDTGTTQLCRSLNGVVKPIDDPFWNTYYPPNHFKCRSTVRQRRSGVVTPNEAISYPDKMPAMFKTNLAKSGLIFPPAHPYWQGMPAHQLKQALDMVPDANDFKIIDRYEGGGEVRMHAKVNPLAPDFSSVKEVAMLKAAAGNKVDIMPVVDDVNNPLYKALFNGAYPGKCPDLRINGQFEEVKHATNPGSKNNLKHAIAEGSKQASHVIVTFDGVQDEHYLKQVAKGRFIDHKQLQVIEFKNGNSLLKFTRAGTK